MMTKGNLKSSSPARIRLVSFPLQRKSRSLPLSQSPRKTADIRKAVTGQVVVSCPAGQIVGVGTIDDNIIIKV